MFRVLTCLTDEHDWRLVVVAGVVCFVASLCAISIFHRALSSQGRARSAWILTASLATGFGIWATHFIAMLAYDPGIGVAYDISLTALSLVIAVAVTYCGLFVAIDRPERWAPPLGGGIVGAGVAAMHYLGMSAVELPGHIVWSLGLVTASIVLGLLFGAASLAIAVRRDTLLNTSIAALVLTLAIVSHHFTAMGAVEIIPDPTRTISPLSTAPMGLAIGIANAALTVLGMSIIASLMDRRLREQSAQTIAALNNMPQGLCMFDAEHRLIVCNKQYAEMYGLSDEQTKPGTALRAILEYRIAQGTAPSDHKKYIDDRITEVTQNKPYQVINKLSNGRYVSVVHNPIKDGGWVATHEDITERQQFEKQRDELASQETRRIAIDNAIASFRERVENVLKTVGDYTNAMKSTATSLFDSSDHTTQRAKEALRESNEASANVATVAIAAEQLSHSITNINQQLAKTTDVVDKTLAKAEATNVEYTELANAAQKIGDVIKLIQNVAGQTNLLALNATIEAARAGEAGRGFAVVASEVKSLAVQTAKATEEISAHIGAVQSSTNSAVDVALTIQERMREISAHSSNAADSVRLQNDATVEITRNAARAAKGTSAVVAVLAEVSDAATGTRTAAETVLASSDSVDTSIGNLRTEIEYFLCKVAV